MSSALSRAGLSTYPRANSMESDDKARMDMTEEAHPKKRMGRPPKAPEKGRRQNYTFRMSDADRDKVVAAADAAGRSVSEEIERRIEDSFRGALAADHRTRILVENVIQIINMIEAGSGKKWWEDEITSGMCGSVLRELFLQLMPEPKQSENSLLKLVEGDKARLAREAKEALWRTTVKMNAMDRAIAILKGNPPDAGDGKAGDILSQSQKI